MRRVALVGSSGGNLHRLGGSDPAALIGAVAGELQKVDAELVAVCFVAADGSLDAVGERSTGSLWLLADGVPRPVQAGSLAEVNEQARAEDARIAREIASGAIDGLVTISADPASTNRSTIEAAAAAGIPAAGSGGSSVAAAEAAGVRFVAASGSTGTTNHTRAIGYAAGFAREWGTVRRGERPSWREVVQRLDPRPVLVDALPAVLAICAFIGLCRHLPWHEAGVLAATVLPLVPLVTAVTAAVRVTTVGQAGMLSGIVAGWLALDAGLLGALVAGLLAGTLANLMVTAALRTRWPATTANILGSGAAGLLAGLAVRWVLAVPGAALDRLVHAGVRDGLAHAGPGIGALLGLAMWPVLLRGLYHSTVLPLMVLEFSSTGLSFLASIDMVTLVAVSAGFALGALLVGDGAERTSARLTLRINVLFGTYVEGSFPAIKGHRAHLGVAMAAATLSGAVVGATGALGVTYIPIPLLPVVGSAPAGLCLAVVVAVVVAMLGSAAVRVRLRESTAR